MFIPVVLPDDPDIISDKELDAAKAVSQYSAEPAKTLRQRQVVSDIGTDIAAEAIVIEATYCIPGADADALGAVETARGPLADKTAVPGQGRIRGELVGRNCRTRRVW